MPLSVAEGAVMGAGMLFATGATLAYKRKQTKLFKSLYFLSCPTLGSAVIWAVTPSQTQMERELRQSGMSEQALDASRAATAAQMEQLRRIAGQDKGGGGSQG